SSWPGKPHPDLEWDRILADVERRKRSEAAARLESRRVLCATRHVVPSALQYRPRSRALFRGAFRILSGCPEALWAGGDSQRYRRRNLLRRRRPRNSTDIY